MYFTSHQSYEEDCDKHARVSMHAYTYMYMYTHVHTDLHIFT